MKFLLTLLSAFFICTPLMAQSSITENTNKRIDELSAPVMDIEARYWADRVKKDSSLSIEQLEKNSSSWLGSEKSNKKLLSLIKKHLKSDKDIALTKEEISRLDESKEMIRKFLNSPEGNIKKQRDEKIDEITSKVRDIKARQLALNVRAKQTTLQELKKISKNWLGSDKENSALLALSEKYINSSKPVAINEEEWDRLAENDRQVRTFLNNGKETDFDRKKTAENKKIRKIDESVFEIEARAWAHRIEYSKDITFDQLALNSISWPGENSYNQKLINKIAENIKTGNTKGLDEKEQKKLNKAKEKIRKILSAGMKKNK